MSARPYVSFITYGRNDGYTPSYARRVSRATACLVRQLERATVDAEIIVVDWNGPADRPHLIDVLDVPAALRHVTVRGIVVDATHHGRFAGARERPIHTGEAANVGLRRARGLFATPKASDTFFSPEAIAMLGRGDLDENTMYRIDRHDVSIDDDAIWDLDDDALLIALQSLPSETHAWIRQVESWGLRDLHTNACGDFTLMSTRHWHRLRGHRRDATVLALDLDSLILHAAAALGVQECRWPDDCRVYKPMHGSLNSARIIQVWADWQQSLDRFLRDKIDPLTALRARMLLDYPRRKIRGVESVVGPSIERNFVMPARRWGRKGPPAPWQPENWGLGDVKLEERMLCRAEWDAAAV
jgi:hypothetical protein